MAQRGLREAARALADRVSRAVRHGESDAAAGTTGSRVRAAAADPPGGGGHGGGDGGGPHAPKPGHTEPTGQVGGKPSGRPTRIGKNVDAAEARSLMRENEAADVLADNGYRVEQNPAPKPNGKKPDYRIEGEYFDCFSPDTNTPVANIRGTLEGKLAKGQADRFVVNAKDWGGNVGDIGPDLAAHAGGGIKEVVVIDKANRVIHVYP